MNIRVSLLSIGAEFKHGGYLWRVKSHELFCTYLTLLVKKLTCRDIGITPQLHPATIVSIKLPRKLKKICKKYAVS